MASGPTPEQQIGADDCGEILDTQVEVPSQQLWQDGIAEPMQREVGPVGMKRTGRQTRPLQRVPEWKVTLSHRVTYEGAIGKEAIHHVLITKVVEKRPPGSKRFVGSEWVEPSYEVSGEECQAIYQQICRGP